MPAALMEIRHRIWMVLALFACASSCGAAIPVLNWRWSNPLPHGNNIKAMVYTNGIALQACELGQVYSSDDLSLWVPRPSHTTNALRAVTFFRGQFVISGENGTIVTGPTPGSLQSFALGTPDWLEGLAASPTRLVAVGDNGAIYTSADAVKWTRQTAGFSDWLRSVAYGTPGGTGKFIAVGEAGFIAVSSDGQNWQSTPAFTGEDLNSIAWVGDQYWIAGNSGQTFVSSLGISWSPVATGATNSLYGIAAQSASRLLTGDQELRLQEGRNAWASQLDPRQASPAPPWSYFTATSTGPEFLLGGRTGMIVEGFKTNSAGAGPTFWQPANDSLRNWIWEAKRWSELYIAVGDKSTIMTSPDAIDWAVELVPDSATNSILLGVGGRTNLAVAVGNAGTILLSPAQLKTVVLTNASGTVSTNQANALGVIWSAVQPRPVTTDLQGVASWGNLLVVSGAGGAILTSPDGSTWTRRSTPTAHFLSSVESFSGGLVASGDQGTILSSPDGIQWKQQPTSTTNWIFRVRYRGGKLFGVGQNGTLLTSTNGVSWTAQNSGTTEWLNDVDWLANTYFVVGTHGALLASNDGVNWTPAPILTEKSLYAITHSAGQLLVGGVEGILLRSELAPPTTPILIKYQTSGAASNAITQQFVFSGDPAQAFTLDRTSTLTNWTTGPRLDFLDSSGFLIYSEQTTNAPPHLFFRAKLVP